MAIYMGNEYTEANMSGSGHAEQTIGWDGVRRPRWENMGVDMREQLRRDIEAARIAGSANSTSTIALGVGAKSIEIEPGKLFVIGERLKIIDKDNVDRFETGTVTAHDSLTGDLSYVVAEGDAQGEGAGSNWRIAPSGERGRDGRFGLDYDFDASSVAAGDPGAGKLRFNNADPAAVTHIYVSKTEDNGVPVAVYLASFALGTSTVKGTLVVKSRPNAGRFHRYSLLAASEQATYIDFTVAHAGGSTAFAAAEDLMMEFVPTGDKGDQGIQGPQGDPGDVTGPVSSTDNAVMRWDGIGGNIAQDSPVTISDAGVIAGAIYDEKTEVSVASAATCNIGAAASNRVLVTGTTTITAFDNVSDGVVRTCRFEAALTLTHHATSLILPGGANITTAAGDIAVMRSEGAGNWRCIDYQVAASAPGAGGSIMLTDSMTNFNTDDTLTWADNVVQIYNCTAAGLDVNLPAITGVPANRPRMFLIGNRGYIAFTVKDAAGNALATVNPMQFVWCRVYDVAGTPAWMVDNGHSGTNDVSLRKEPLPQPGKFYGNDGSNEQTYILGGCFLTASRWVVFSVSGTDNKVYMTYYTQIGASVRILGNGFSCVAGNTHAKCTAIMRTSDTSFMICYPETNTWIRFRHYVVTNPDALTAACTVGNIGMLTIAGTWSAGYFYWDMLDEAAGKIICAYRDDVNALNACVVTWSGNNATVNTEYPISTSDCRGVSVAALTTSIAVAAYFDATAGHLKVVRLSVSGTAVTVGTIVTAESSSYTPWGLWVVSDTRAILFYVSGINLYYRTVDDDGSATLVVGAQQTLIQESDTFGNSTGVFQPFIPMSRTVAYMCATKANNWAKPQQGYKLIYDTDTGTVKVTRLGVQFFEGMWGAAQNDDDYALSIDRTIIKPHEGRFVLGRGGYYADTTPAQRYPIEMALFYGCQVNS